MADGHSRDMLNYGSEVTTLTLDALGRTTMVADPLTHTTQTIVDAMGRQVGSINGVGDVQQMSLDLLGQPSFNVSAEQSLEKKTFDGAGRMTSLTDPIGNKTRFIYDARGQLIEEIDAAGESILREYDAAGRLEKITDRLGRVREFTYFDNNQLQQEDWRNSSGGGIVWTRSWTYNDNGQVLTATDNNGTYTFTYDELGRIAAVEDIWGITLTYTFDAGDRLTNLDDSLGGAQVFHYDAANRNDWRSFDDGVTEARINLYYTDRGELEEIRRYADVTASTLLGKTLYVYDDAGRVESITHKDDANVTLDDFVYDYDNANRVTQEVSTLGPTRDYEYDQDSQLTDDGTNSWAWDAAGNRDSYTVDPGNRVTSDGTFDYVHDDEGNIISKVDSGTDETWLYSYNQLNQLVEAEHDPDGVGSGSGIDLRVEYVYDVLGNLIERSVDADGDGGGSAVAEQYAYDRHGNAWADLSSGGTSLTTRRLYMDAVDALFARIDSGPALDWYLTDRLGSVRDIMDSASTIQDHLDYFGFGEVDAESDPAYGDRYKFTSRELDDETGLQYNRARWYSFDVSWMSEDPIRWAAGDANLYRYVTNQPSRLRDPNGCDDEAEFKTYQRAATELRDTMERSLNEFSELTLNTEKEALQNAINTGNGNFNENNVYNPIRRYSSALTEKMNDGLNARSASFSLAGLYITMAWALPTLEDQVAAAYDADLVRIRSVYQTIEEELDVELRFVRRLKNRAIQRGLTANVQFQLQAVESTINSNIAILYAEAFTHAAMRNVVFPAAQSAAQSILMSLGTNALLTINEMSLSPIPCMYESIPVTLGSVLPTFTTSGDGFI